MLDNAATTTERRICRSSKWHPSQPSRSCSRHHAKRRTRINLLPPVSGRVFVEMRRMSVRMRVRRRITQIRILRRRAVVLRAICPIKASTCNKRPFIHPVPYPHRLHDDRFRKTTTKSYEYSFDNHNGRCTFVEC